MIQPRRVLQLVAQNVERADACSQLLLGGGFPVFVEIAGRQRRLGQDRGRWLGLDGVAEVQGLLLSDSVEL